MSDISSDIVCLLETVIYRVGLWIEKEYTTASNKKYWVEIWKGFKENCKKELGMMSMIPALIVWHTFDLIIHR